MIRRREERPVVATREMARRRRRRRALVALGVGTAVVAGTGYGAWRFIEENEYLLEERCSVSSVRRPSGSPLSRPAPRPS